MILLLIYNTHSINLKYYLNFNLVSSIYIDLVENDMAHIHLLHIIIPFTNILLSLYRNVLDKLILSKFDSLDYWCWTMKISLMMNISILAMLRQYYGLNIREVTDSTIKEQLMVIDIILI